MKHNAETDDDLRMSLLQLNDALYFLQQYINGSEDPAAQPESVSRMMMTAAYSLMDHAKKLSK